MPWDPEQYLAFSEPRLRPALDLLARVGAEDPRRVLDLGCGAGNVTARLAGRWPDAEVVGLDRSSEMLRQAEAAAPGVEWIEADIAAWEPPAPFDVVYSNAALHWLHDHDGLLPRLAGWLTPGGWLAIQMPDNHAEPSHRLLLATAARDRWADRLTPLLRISPVADSADYYDLLAPLAGYLDVWRTTYVHILEGPDPVLEWTKGSVLRPILAALPPHEQEAFTAEYATALRAAYPPRADGRTLLPFRRLFLVACI